MGGHGSNDPTALFGLDRDCEGCVNVKHRTEAGPQRNSKLSPRAHLDGADSEEANDEDDNVAVEVRAGTKDLKGAS